LLKALSVRDKVGNDPVVLAADTVVSLDGRILGKPKDEADAETMLRLLSGRTHAVYTGVALVRDTRQIYRYETTLVSFRQLSQYEISAYISTGEPMDKAGAYGAQGIASLFIRRIEGDYFNVVGLPLFLLGSMLEELGLSAL
jgi:septum formation protein